MAASFAGWNAALVRTEIVLCELEPSVTVAGFTVVGGAYPTTYQVSFSRFTQTTTIPGGIYRPIIGMTQNDVALTAQTSIANVEATAGSYYWDEANGLLYVHTTTGADPDTFTVFQATVRLRFSNAPIVLETTPGTASTAVYHHPWLTDDLPTVQRQVDDLLAGVTVLPGGNVSFINGHRAWHALVAADGVWNWKYKTARFAIGGSYNGQSLTRSQYATVTTMLIEDVAPTEQVCTFMLQPKQRLTERELPVSPFFSSDYPSLGNGVEGTKKWIGYGRTMMTPDLTNTSAYGVYTVADAAFQTLFAVHGVYAVNKNTGVWTALTLTTHYTVNLTTCTVTIVSATYTHQDYDIAVDVTGKPDGAGSYLKTWSAIVSDLLTTFLGVAAADKNSTAFATAALEADAELSCWIKSPRTMASVLSTAEAGFPCLARSTMGTVQQTVDGIWTVDIWDPDVDAITTELRQQDFASFAPKPKLKTVYSKVTVYYNYNHARDQWSAYSVEDLATKYRTGSRDELAIYTYLRSASNAQTIAQRYSLLAGAVTVEAAFEERGALLATNEAGSKAYVTFTPAPTVSGGYARQPMEALSMEFALAPKFRVHGVVGDLRGLGGRIGRWTAPAAPDWATATADERLASGFWNDPNGFADPTDAASGNRSLWW